MAFQLNPVSQSARVGEVVTLEAMYAEDFGYSWQWQRSIDGGSYYADISGASGLADLATLIFTVGAGEDRYRYRVFQNSQYSEPAIISTTVETGTLVDSGFESGTDGATLSGWTGLGTPQLAEYDAVAIVGSQSARFKSASGGGNSGYWNNAILGTNVSGSELRFWLRRPTNCNIAVLDYEASGTATPAGDRAFQVTLMSDGTVYVYTNKTGNPNGYTTGATGVIVGYGLPVTAEYSLLFDFSANQRYILRWRENFLDPWKVLKRDGATDDYIPLYGVNNPTTQLHGMLWRAALAGGGEWWLDDIRYKTSSIDVGQSIIESTVSGTWTLAAKEATVTGNWTLAATPSQEVTGAWTLIKDWSGTVAGAWTLTSIRATEATGNWTLVVFPTALITGAWTLLGVNYSETTGMWTLRVQDDEEWGYDIEVSVEQSSEVLGAWTLAAIELIEGSLTGTWTLQRTVESTVPGDWTLAAVEAGLLDGSIAGTWTLRRTVESTATGTWSLDVDQTTGNGSIGGAWTLVLPVGSITGTWTLRGGGSHLRVNTVVTAAHRPTAAGIVRRASLRKD